MPKQVLERKEVIKIFRYLSVFLKAETVLENSVCYLASNIDIAIELPSKKEVLDKLYSKLAAANSQNKSKFYFVLNAIDFQDFKAENLGRFFFLKNYKCRSFGSPLVALKNGESHPLYDKLATWYTSQGFYKPDVLDYTVECPEALHKDLLYLVDNGYKEYIQKILIKDSDILKCVLQPTTVRIDDSAAFGTLLKDLKNLEEQVAVYSPTIPIVLAYLLKTEERNLSLYTSLSYHQEETKFLKMYNEMLRSENESQTILKFYTEQYEVLPLWYKRFGHIIKIIMGKRKVNFPF